MEKEKGIVGVKWIKRQERGRKCKGGNEALGEWEGPEVREQRRRGTGEVRTQPSVGNSGERVIRRRGVGAPGHGRAGSLVGGGRSLYKIAGWGEERVQGTRGRSEDRWWRKWRNSGCEMERKRRSRACSPEVAQRRGRGWERENKWKAWGAGLSPATGNPGYHFLSPFAFAAQLQEKERNVTNGGTVHRVLGCAVRVNRC